MNWLTNFVRPKVRALVAQKEMPDNLWGKMPRLQRDAVQRELEDISMSAAIAANTSSSIP